MGFQLLGDARLADARLAREQDDRAVPGQGIVERGAKEFHLLLAADERATRKTVRGGRGGAWGGGVFALGVRHGGERLGIGAFGIDSEDARGDIRFSDGQTYAVTFPASGAYGFTCVVHPATMNGSVVVR